MDYFAYVAATGTNVAMNSQAINANNLANVSTPGFRADLAKAESTYLVGQGIDSRIYANLGETMVDFSPGMINTTGRELDVAINGEGWIAVQNAEGEEAYSRRGDLIVDSLGRLTNGAGQPILGESGPIALPPHSDLVIGADGGISIVPQGESPNAITEVDRIRLVNPPQENLTKGLDGLIYQREGAEPERDDNVRLVSKSLESSNVNSVEAMVNMIDLARQFEFQVKLMAKADEMDRSSVELMNVT